MEKINVTLRHYNKLKPINCSVISGDVNKIFTVQVDENENLGAGIIKGDPVLIGMIGESDIVRINGGIVIGAAPENDKYIICSNENINIAKEFEKREYERYPVSIFGDIKTIDLNKRENACIKDISYSGMCIYSTGDFNVNDIVEVTLYLNNNVTRFDGTIIRRGLNFGRNEYGIQIMHRDKIAMDAAKSLIFNLLQSENELINRHLLSSKFNLFNTDKVI